MQNVRYIMREPHICFTQASEEEIIALNPEDGQFYHLNASAVDLWQYLEMPRSLEALALSLLQKYDVTGSDDYLHDVISWVDAMCERGLLSSQIRCEDTSNESEVLK